MAATQAQIDVYITDIRTAVSDYGDLLSRKQRLGQSDLYCDKVNLMLLSGYLDCLYDYFLQYSENITYLSENTPPENPPLRGEEYPAEPVVLATEYNFFTPAEIRDVMQHLNNICGTFYIVEV
jgi:hypothetical protein